MRRSVRVDVTVDARHRLARLISKNKPFIVVWLALFIAIAGTSMVSPLMPVFAEDMGASGIWVGLAFSGFAFTQIPLMPVMGRLSDRFGKKIFLCLGLSIYSVTAVGYLWSPGYQELVLFRVLSGIGAAMVVPVAFAYIGDLVPYEHEGRYMGLFNVAMIAGFGIGPVFGGAIYDGLGMNAAFGGMALLSALGFGIVLFFLPKRPSSSGATFLEGEIEFQKPSSSYASLLRDNVMRGIFTFQIVIGIIFGTMLAFIGIWMTDILETSVAQVGIVLSVRVVANGTLTYPFGWLADRMSRVILASVGMTMAAIGTFAVPWLGSFTSLMCLFLVMGLFESMAGPSINAIAVEKGRSLGMGSVFGAFNMATSLGLITGSMVGGMVEGSMGIVYVFRFAAVLALTGVVIFNVFMLRSTRVSSESIMAIQSRRL